MCKIAVNALKWVLYFLGEGIIQKKKKTPKKSLYGLLYQIELTHLEGREMKLKISFSNEYRLLAFLTKISGNKAACAFRWIYKFT